MKSITTNYYKHKQCLYDVSIVNETFSAFFVFRLSKFYQQRKLFKYNGDGSAFKNETKREDPEEEVTKSFVNNLMVCNSKNGTSK